MARFGAAAGALVAALIVVIIALTYLADAVLVGLQSIPMHPAAARALTGAICLVVAGLIAWIAVRLVSGPRRRAYAPAPAPVRSPGAIEMAAAEIGAIMARQASSTARAHPFSTTGAALAAGLAVGAIPELRKLVTDLLRRR